MSEMSSIQGRRDPQRRLRAVARRLRHSWTSGRGYGPRPSCKPAMNRQSTPATRREALADACAWRLDEKPRLQASPSPRLGEQLHAS